MYCMKQKIVNIFAKYLKILPISVGLGVMFVFSFITGNVIPFQQAEAGAIFITRPGPSLASGSP